MGKAFSTGMVFAAIAFAACIATAQEAKSPAPSAAKPASAEQERQPGHEYSGMYSFLKEGEFVQITVEDNGNVTGYLSRYGDAIRMKNKLLLSNTFAAAS